MKTMIIDTITVITITKDSSRPGDRENKELTVHLQKQYLYNYIIYYIYIIYLMESLWESQGRLV